MTHSIVFGKKRITSLSPGLIRLEFSPDGIFEDRRSMVAYAQKAPIPFLKIEKIKDGGVEIATERMKIQLRDPDHAFYPTNTEVRWIRDDLLHYWRPGDRDHQNLGGTVHALDQLSPRSQLGGRVHVADMESPDLKANVWQDGDFSWGMTPYYQASPDPTKEQQVRQGDRHVRQQYDPELFLSRSLNVMLDQYAYAPGILSKSGYFFLNDSDSAVLDESDTPIPRNRPGYQDWYFFAYGWDYEAALADFRLLSGPAPLPPAGTLGIMCCRWPAYNEQEAMELATRFKKEGFPLSTLIIDMEWHRPGWYHWEWNPESYPDPARFFQWARTQKILTSLNIHPQKLRSDDSHYQRFIDRAGDPLAIHEVKDPDGTFQAITINMADAKQARAMMDLCARTSRDYGVDFWWVDGAHAFQNSTTNEQLITNKWYFENTETTDHRGMLLARYGGLGSHRYGAFFTGDTHSKWGVLEKLCEFNIRAGQVGVAYISHDTGGFTHPETPLIDPLLYVRWLQFGVFNPILRFHSAPGSGSRAPWDYGEANLEICRKWLQWRNKLLPYLYHAARQTYETGLPIVRGMFLTEPQNQQAYRFDQFMFGDHLLVAPLLSSHEDRSVYLPEGSWIRIDTGESYCGGRELTICSKLEEYPVWIKSGSVIPLYDGIEPGMNTDAALTLLVTPGNGSGSLYEDDGISQKYRQTQWRKIKFTLKEESDAWILSIPEIQGDWAPVERKVSLMLPRLTELYSILVNGKTISESGEQTALPFQTICLGTQTLNTSFQIQLQKKTK